MKAEIFFRPQTNELTNFQPFCNDRWADEQNTKCDDLTKSSHQYVEQLMLTWEQEKEKFSKTVLSRYTPEYMSMSSLCAFPRSDSKGTSSIDILNPVRKELYNIRHAAKLSGTMDNHLVTKRLDSSESTVIRLNGEENGMIVNLGKSQEVACDCCPEELDNTASSSTQDHSKKSSKITNTKEKNVENSFISTLLQPTKLLKCDILAPSASQMCRCIGDFCVCYA